MPPHRDWSQRPLSLLVALMVAMSAVVLSAVGIFDPVEDGLTAKRAELLARPATGQVAIVEIDARSLAELRRWPWPRQYHAQVIRQLHKAGASIIAFDVDFSARSDSGDAELASAIREAGHVVLPIFSQKSSTQQEDMQIIASRPDAAFRDAWVGGVNIFPDADGIVREYPAATIIDDAIQPSIATLVAEKDDLGDRSFQPDWAIDRGGIPRFSFVDVMNGRVPRQDLSGKRLLIGATAIELGDRYAVPRYGVVPGVVVQALAAESLLQGRAMQRTGSLITILGALLIAVLLAPRPVPRTARYAFLCGTVIATILTGPIIVQKILPVSVESAAWLFAAFAAISVQSVIEARRRLRMRAETDLDTGMANRAAFEQALEAHRETPSILVTAAIERFENIRDAAGLAASNEVIRKAAEVIESLVGATLHRIDSDVLAWVHADGDEDAAAANLRRIQEALRVSVETSAGTIDVTFTFGLEQNDGRTLAVIRIERALSAISSARGMGKAHDWYRGADPQLRRQLSMMGDLRLAMEQGRLHLAYQPKKSLHDERIADAEALIRWQDADGHMVSPDEFIPLAEATGVIREVTIFALRTAAADLAHWAQQGVGMRLAVNISAHDLASTGFVKTVTTILKESGVPASQLALEVTESALIRSPAEAVATLKALREAGIRLSVDDYGTGQSTLSYLKHLPVHELKIDKSFVTGLASSESDQIMVRSTINLAHELGLQVVAEGIEDRRTLDMLRQLGCDYAQGYFISKPLTSSDFFAFASERRAA